MSRPKYAPMMLRPTLAFQSVCVLSVISAIQPMINGAATPAITPRPMLPKKRSRLKVSPSACLLASVLAEVNSAATRMKASCQSSELVSGKSL